VNSRLLATIATVCFCFSLVSGASTSGWHQRRGQDQNKGILLENLTWQEAEKALRPETVVVIPLGAQAKEHGPHLKLKNDWAMEWSIRPDDPPEGDGSGYVVDCLRSARWAVETGDYEQVVKSAISLGQDTDTTACVAGGMAGIRDINAIPERWRNELRGKELYEEELRRLVEWRLGPRG
jgi:hypothetical protein